MNIFKYEGFMVKIDPEALLLKPFRELWERDKSDDKATALLELGYVYFFCDPRSDYQTYIDEDERTEQIIRGEGMPKGWKPDAKVKKAMELYSSFEPASVKLLESTKRMVDKLRRWMEDIDFTATDENGKPMVAMNTITSTIKQIPDLMSQLYELERKMQSDMHEAGKVRGSAEKTIFDDDLDA